MHEFFSSESKCTQGAMSRRQRPRKVVVKTELKTTVASLSLSPQEKSENGSPSKLDCSENAERALLHCAHSCDEELCQDCAGLSAGSTCSGAHASES